MCITGAMNRLNPSEYFDGNWNDLYFAHVLHKNV
jgi:hypothetical protein